MPLLLALLLIPLLVIVLIPVSLVARIRRGTMRRQALGWVVKANAIVLPTSSAHHAQPSPRRKAMTAIQEIWRRVMSGVLQSI
jgi:hypothetical protein